MHGVAFEDLDEARAVFALGPLAFRCGVCGRVHRSERNGWEPCARKLEAEYGLARVGTDMHVCAFLSSPAAGFRPAALGSPQVLLSVRPDGLRPVIEQAVRGVLAAWRDAVGQELGRLAGRLNREWSRPGRWWKFSSPAGLERGRLLECALMAARFALRYSRKTRVLAWGNGAAWILAYADAGARFPEKRGLVWPAGGMDLVFWAVADAAPAEELVGWMASALTAGKREFAAGKGA